MNFLSFLEIRIITTSVIWGSPMRTFVFNSASVYKDKRVSWGGLISGANFVAGWNMNEYSKIQTVFQGHPHVILVETILQGSGS